jgi:hypothetical protein
MQRNLIEFYSVVNKTEINQILASKEPTKRKDPTSPKNLEPEAAKNLKRSKMNDESINLVIEPLQGNSLSAIRGPSAEKEALRNKFKKDNACSDERYLQLSLYHHQRGLLIFVPKHPGNTLQLYPMGQFPLWIETLFLRLFTKYINNDLP